VIKKNASFANLVQELESATATPEAGGVLRTSTRQMLNRQTESARPYEVLHSP